MKIINQQEFKEVYAKKLRLRTLSAVQGVDEIIREVALRGDAALRSYTEKFDGVCLGESLRMPQEQIEEYAAQCDPAIVRALENAAANIRDFHSRQKKEGFSYTRGDGELLGQRVAPLNRVGIYVPGGTAAYPSSVLMCAIPAQIAGVKEIAMVTPPPKPGRINYAVFAAVKLLGITEVYTVGGAQAVAALALGTESVPRVDKIAGPGNAYVAQAKKLLYGTVDIDMIAGPSEVLIVADSQANPKFLAADLMSQAEHDRLASAILVTDSAALAERVNAELERQLKTLSRNEIIRDSLENQSFMVVADSIESCCEIADEIAPEHLEVAVREPLALLDRLHNAGSVFLGEWSPEPLGDYYAGPNHVLPTNGTARFFSPLGVDSFVRRTGYIFFNKTALSKAKADIIALADCEGLTAHANSVKVRFEDEK